MRGIEDMLINQKVTPIKKPLIMGGEFIVLVYSFTKIKKIPPGG